MVRPLCACVLLLARINESNWQQQCPLVKVMDTPGAGPALLARLSPQSLLRLSRTCLSARNAIASYVADAFNINTTLSRFFPDPSSFRSLQARTGTLISGSVALQFFDRTFYPTSDLDIYVHLKHRREVGDWLLTMGYTFCPTRGQNTRFGIAVLSPVQRSNLRYAMPGVQAIFTFSRSVLNATLRVQIIVARRAPMEIVLASHSSCCCNSDASNSGYVPNVRCIIVRLLGYYSNRPCSSLIWGLSLNLPP